MHMELPLTPCIPSWVLNISTDEHSSIFINHELFPLSSQQPQAIFFFCQSLSSTSLSCTPLTFAILPSQPLRETSLNEQCYLENHTHAPISKMASKILAAFLLIYPSLIGQRKHSMWTVWTSVICQVTLYMVHLGSGLESGESFLGRVMVSFLQDDRQNI